MTGSTATALHRLAAPLRQWSRLGWLALSLGGVCLVVGAAAWLVRLRPPADAAWVPVTWTFAVLVLLAAGWLGRRMGRRLTEAAVAGRLEASGAWRTGALTALLESPAAGTSPALLAAADRAGADQLSQRGVEALSPLRGEVLRRSGLGVGCLLLGLLLLGSARPTRGPAAALWHPVRTWRVLRAPVRLEVSAREVERGGSVTLTVDAPGRRDATLWLRAPGESWRALPLQLDSSGRAAHRAGPLAGDLYARASSGGRESDTLMVRVRLPAFLGVLTVTAHYPRYLGLDPEPIPTGGDTVVIPAGTRLDVRGEATAPLSGVAWVLDSVRVPLSADRQRFSGELRPRRSGRYRLALATAGGVPLAGDTVWLPLRVLPDSAPVVAVPVPGRDTVAPVDLQVPLVLDVRDDHAVRSLRLESRRISRLGLADSARTETIPLPGPVDRAVVPFTLDLNARGLLPGDTIRYRAVAVDNTPGGQSGRSPEYVLRLATLAEIRAAQRAASAAVTAGLDSLTDRSVEIARSTEDLAETQQNRARSGESRDPTLNYQQAQRGEEAVRNQQELVARADSLRQAIAALRESAARAGLDDPAWRQRLAEVEQELARAMTPEMQQALERLQSALKQLDPERTSRALEQLAEAQQQLRQALERTRELFRRAALEGDLRNLAEEARDLTAEQQEWARQAAQADSQRAAGAERELKTRADSLAAALQRAATAAGKDSTGAALQQAGQQAHQAAGQMNQAARSAASGRREPARQQGEAAAQSLQPLGQQLDQTRQAMQSAWRKEVGQTLDRALSETTQLSQRQLAIQQGFQRGDDPAGLRREQAAVEEGVQQLLEQVQRAAGKNALVNPQIGAALAAAQQEMQGAREAVSTASPNTREAGDRAGSAVDALNAAAYQLVQAQGEVAGAASGSGLSEALQKMSQLARQQGQLSQQGAGLLPMPGGSGLQQQLQSLAARQRALAQEMDRLRAGGNLPGAGQLADEAHDLARRLDGGRIDRSVVERQERLFRRMLDAGRTLQGREPDDQKQRRSTTAREGNVHLPPALRARLQPDGAPRLPSWDELQRLSPEERRLVMDYFQRLTATEGP